MVECCKNRMLVFKDLRHPRCGGRRRRGELARSYCIIRLGLDYTRLNIDSREAAAQYRDSGETDEAARQRVVDNWAEINRIARVRVNR